MLERLIAVCAALFLLTAGSQAADWPLQKVDTNSCVASGPQTDDASLSVITIGPQIMLLVGAKDFPQATDSYKIGINFDDGPVRALDAEGRDGQFGMMMTPVLADALRRATRMTARYDGKAHEFALDGAGPAIDAVLRCAGQPPYDQLIQHHAKPVAGADRWLIESTLPGADTCTARDNGAQIDTVLMLNKFGKLILIAAHPDWARPLTKFEATLQIDQDSPIKTQTSAFTNLVLTPMADSETARLRSAHSLAWHFPWGDYRSDVTGLGIALDALTACQAQKHPAP